MDSTLPRRVRRLAGLAFAVVATAAAFVGAGPAGIASADDCAVPVVVSFDRLPNASGTEESCSADPQNAAEALYRAGFSITIDENSLKICDINSAPGDNCESAGQGIGWSHWIIPAGASEWEKASRDVTARDPMPGDVEGWTYRPTTNDEDVPPPAPNQTPPPDPTTPPATTPTIPTGPTGPGVPDPGVPDPGIPDPAVPGEDGQAPGGDPGADGGVGSGGGGSGQDGSATAGSGTTGPASNSVRADSRTAAGGSLFDFFDGKPMAEEESLTSAATAPASPWLLIGLGGFVLFSASFVAWFRHRQLAARRSLHR